MEPDEKQTDTPEVTDTTTPEKKNDVVLETPAQPPKPEPEVKEPEQQEQQQETPAKKPRRSLLLRSLGLI